MRMAVHLCILFLCVCEFSIRVIVLKIYQVVQMSRRKKKVIKDGVILKRLYSAYAYHLLTGHCWLVIVVRCTVFHVFVL